MNVRLLQTWLSLFTIQGSWNHERMLGVGTGVASLPLLRGLRRHRGEEAYRAAVARSCSYFNAHPYLAGMAVAAEARAEIEEIPPAQIERFRCALGSPLGSLGDRLVWAGWLPASVGVGLLIYGVTGHWIAALVFLLVYNAAHLGLRVWALRMGWSLGLQVANALGASRLRWAVQFAPVGAALLLGLALPVATRRLALTVVAPGSISWSVWAGLLGLVGVTTLVLRRLAPTIGSIRLALGMAVVVVLGGIVWPS